MDKLKNYLLSNFSQIYFSIFLPLFVIASVIILIKVAAYTAYIQLNFLEMIKLYLFSLPDLLFYTLPVTFFVSAVMTISKLSFDYEMLVIFSLGIKPSSIVVFFTKLAVLQSLLLFVLFFIISPHTKNLAFNFMDKKRSEAKFNIEASAYGHKFGDWMIFVGESESEGEYGKVILFNQKDKEETLLVADSASVVSHANTLKLELREGKGFTYSAESLSQMKFRVMHINDTTSADAQEYKSTFKYWFGDKALQAEQKTNGYETLNKKEKGLRDYYYLSYGARFNAKMQKLTNQILITFFPILSVLMILSIGVINARHQKSFTYLYIFTTVILYYAATFTLSKPLGMYTLILLPLVTIISTYYIYNRSIAARY